jgi:predicted metal-binding protein
LADATIPEHGIADEDARVAGVTIYVCVTCRGGKPLDLVPAPGETLLAATAGVAAGAGGNITVRPVRCLANCNRGLSAAVRRDGAWTAISIRRTALLH